MSKTKIILQLDFDTPDELNIGLVKCVKELPDYYFFYLLNTQNSFHFERKTDLKFIGTNFDTYYSVYEAFSEEIQNTIRFFSNAPCHRIQKKEITELFSEETEEQLLFPNSEIRYIMNCSQYTDDFSLILQPKTDLFQIENFLLSPDEKLFDLIQYYE